MFLWWASTTLDLLCTTTQGSLTVRQPLEKMGEIAARTLLKRLEDHGSWLVPATNKFHYGAGVGEQEKLSAV
jgi:hypothetical protein